VYFVPDKETTAMIRKRLPLFCLVLLALAARVSLAEDPDDARATPVTVTLTDGSHVLGVPSFTTIPLDTSFAQMKIPLTAISRIRFDQDHRSARIDFSNGDRITGSVAQESFTFAAIFGQITVGREHVLAITTGGVAVSDGKHDIRFSSSSVLRNFRSTHPGAWRVEDSEAVGTSPGKGVTCELTYDKHFKSIRKVLIQGRIVGPRNENFRLAVGPIHLIFNWELADQNHFRNGRARTVLPGHALTAGKTHSIAVSQEKECVVVSVDNREVYRTEATLAGTVTLQAAEGSTIAVSRIVIDGDVDPQRLLGRAEDAQGKALAVKYPPRPGGLSI
jgi:hypothetical protein